MEDIKEILDKYNQLSQKEKELIKDLSQIPEESEVGQLIELKQDIDKILKLLPKGYVIVDYEKLKDYLKDADGTFGESPVTKLIKYAIEVSRI